MIKPAVRNKNTDFGPPMDVPQLGPPVRRPRPPFRDDGPDMKRPRGPPRDGRDWSPPPVRGPRGRYGTEDGFKKRKRHGIGLIKLGMG